MVLKMLVQNSHKLTIYLCQFLPLACLMIIIIEFLATETEPNSSTASISNLFMSVCMIFLYIVLLWCHEILRWKFIMIFLSVLWNLFWGKLRLRKGCVSSLKKIPQQFVLFFTYYHNKFSSQNNVRKYRPHDMKRFIISKKWYGYILFL